MQIESLLVLSLLLSPPGLLLGLHVQTGEVPSFLRPSLPEILTGSVVSLPWKCVQECYRVLLMILIVAQLLCLAFPRPSSVAG